MFPRANAGWVSSATLHCMLHAWARLHEHQTSTQIQPPSNICQIYPCTNREGIWDSGDALQSFLTSAPDGGASSASRLIQYSLNGKLGGPQSRSGCFGTQKNKNITLLDGVFGLPARRLVRINKWS